MVGGKSYTFLGEEDTSAFKCMDKCTYSEDGKEGTKVCFAAGDLDTECKDSSAASMATTGAAKPTTGAAGKSNRMSYQCLSLSSDSLLVSYILSGTLRMAIFHAKEATLWFILYHFMVIHT